MQIPPAFTLIETSADLKSGTWTPLTAVPAAADRGTMSFTDPDTVLPSHRFYGAVLP